MTRSLQITAGVLAFALVATLFLSFVAETPTIQAAVETAAVIAVQSGFDDAEKKDDGKKDGGKKDSEKKDESPAPVKSDEVKKEESQKEEPTKDAPKPEEPKVEPKKDEPKKAAPKPEEPKKSEPPKNEPKDESKKPEPAPAQPAKPKLDAVEVVTEPVKTRLVVSGQFESAEAVVIRLKAKEFAAFELVEVVPHAANVSRGDTLVRFSERKYQEALAERRRALRTSELSLREAEIGLAAMKARRPLQFEEMEITQRESDEDHNYFLEYERDLMQRLTQFRRRSSDISREAAREELRQLEKMYEADDLVEDTEEFILKRTRFQVEANEFDYKTNQESLRRTLEVLLARRDRSATLRKRLSDIDYQRAREVFSFAEELAMIQLDRSRQAHATLVENFEKFVADEKWLVLKAPTDGMAYYGEYDNGKWQGGTLVQQSLKVGEMIKNDTVLLTIVEPRPTRFRAVVPEQELHRIVPDISGQIAPAAFPDLRFRARLLDLPPYPAASNEYIAKFVVRGVESSRLVPGMTGKIEMVVYDNKEAILVPTSAMKQETLDDDSYNHRYVWVVSADGTSAVKTKVRIGTVVGDKTEVVSNLQKGQSILKAPPAK